MRTPCITPALTRASTPVGERVRSDLGARRTSSRRERTKSADRDAPDDEERIPRGLGTRIISAETALKRHTEDLVRMQQKLDAADGSFRTLQSQVQGLQNQDAERGRLLEARFSSIGASCQRTPLSSTTPNRTIYNWFSTQLSNNNDGTTSTTTTTTIHWSLRASGQSSHAWHRECIQWPAS